MHLNALKLKLSRKETPTWLSTCDDCGTNRSLRWLHIILDFRIKKWKNYNLHSVTMGYRLNYKTWENRRSVEEPHIWFILPNCVYNLNSQNIKKSCLMDSHPVAIVWINCTVIQNQKKCYGWVIYSLGFTDCLADCTGQAYRHIRFVSYLYLVPYSHHWNIFCSTGFY